MLGMAGHQIKTTVPSLCGTTEAPIPWLIRDLGGTPVMAERRLSDYRGDNPVLPNMYPEISWINIAPHTPIGVK